MQLTQPACQASTEAPAQPTQPKCDSRPQAPVADTSACDTPSEPSVQVGARALPHVQAYLPPGQARIACVATGTCMARAHCMACCYLCAVMPQVR